jgi:hypothetical protein
MYAGKPTKKYLKLTEQILKPEKRRKTEKYFTFENN